ncbi:MAG: hypothetical protein K9K37_04385 [Desulfocapsa sp.]|nr:hypothetical protein [Desulfocapsa sp.]
MLQTLKNKWHLFYANSDNKQFLRFLLIALILRMMIMPFFGHIDLLSEARRVFYWAENNIFIDNIARNTTMFIEVIFFRIFHFLLPESQSMFFHADIAHSMASVPHSFEFVSHLTTFRTFFIFKIPYLVCDLATAVILYNYFSDKQKGLRSSIMWLFNPVTIFAFYIFGRFESIPIFFIAAALLALKKNKIILAALLLGLCLNGREMMILYFPIFLVAIVFSTNTLLTLRQKIIGSLLIIVFAAVTMQIFSVLGIHTVDAAGSEGVVLVKENRIQHLFAFSLHRIMFLPLAYTLVIIWVFISTVSEEKKLLLGGGIAMMSFFAFTAHTAHFTSWMVIFPAIFYGYNRTFLKPFIVFCLVWVGYWMFMTDLGVFTLWLAAPFSLHFTGIPNIPTLYSHMSGNFGIFDLNMIIYMMRTFFLASLISLAWLMIHTTIHSDEKTLH